MTIRGHWLIKILGLCFLHPVTGQSQSLPDTLRHTDWHLYWSSEFREAGDSSAVTSQWQFAYPWGRNLGGYEGQYYTGEQVSVDSADVLHLKARRLPHPKSYRVGGGPVRQLDYESGMLFSRFKGDSMRLTGCSDSRTGFTYGLFEIRCRLPRTPNSFSAFWLYGDPDEVDVFEAGTPELITNNIILWSHEFWRTGPLRVANEASQSFFYWPGPGSLVDGFHTMAVSWQPTELVYYFDGIAIRHESRLLPLGCPLDVIANLGMYQWAHAPADSLDIDYIRVYKPRRAWPQAPIALSAPIVGALQLPHTTDAVLGTTNAEQQWQVHTRPNSTPRLVLQINRNPRDFSTLALPSQGQWLTPLIAFGNGDSPRHWVASPDSGRAALSWTLYDVYGHPVRNGEQAPATRWELSWPELPPGAYSLHLRLGALQVYQKVYQLGRPETTVFTPEWLTPLPAETTE